MDEVYGTLIELPEDKDDLLYKYYPNLRKHAVIQWFSKCLLPYLPSSLPLRQKRCNLLELPYARRYICKP